MANETLEELKAKYGVIRTLIIPLDEDDETKIETEATIILSESFR